MIYVMENRLIWRMDKEILMIEPWGKNSLRVRATRNGRFFEDIPSALTEEIQEDGKKAEIILEKEGKAARITNGKLVCLLSETGKLKFLNDKGEVLLEEYERDRFREVMEGDFYSALEIHPREMKPIPLTDSYQLTERFEAADGEQFFGMGQYQQNILDLKGCRLELAQRNSQITIPFTISSRGYGFLWNNPAIGYATFAQNVTEWHADSSKQLDFWVTAGDTPAMIEEAYANVTGKAPMMPEYGMGFWQCKLRYWTQDELLSVAREYKKRNVPLDVIVADFFHWPNQGDWKFDRDYWPDPKAMVDELNEMGVKLMVSVWPTVETSSENYAEMEENGFLIQTEAGRKDGILSNAGIMDVTNPECRKYVWEKLKRNYYNDGVRIFWLDEAEPELTKYEFQHYRYYAGSDMQVGNVYPREYAKMAYEGMEAEGQENILNLIRCAWAGSQKYGTLVWSGDIDSSFRSLKNQITAGLGMGLAGIPWWNTDIGGFGGADVRDESFKELLIRWFEFGTFSPVMRLHGYRKPFREPLSNKGGGKCNSGADNEIWSYGPEVYEILKSYIELREKLRPYIREVMKAAHEKGTPVMRTLFYEFPEDKYCWKEKDEYFFGPDILVKPITDDGIRETSVYLPNGSEWKNAWTGEEYTGGEKIKVQAPLEKIPLFIRKGSSVAEIFFI